MRLSGTYPLLSNSDSWGHQRKQFVTGAGHNEIELARPETVICATHAVSGSVVQAGVMPQLGSAPGPQGQGMRRMLYG